MKPVISKDEFARRIQNAQKVMKEKGIDILLAYGNEGEPQYQRYFSNFHPSFETAGVMFAQSGAPILLVGPESREFGLERGYIANVRSLGAFRESISPQYTGEAKDTFRTVIEELAGGTQIATLAIAGYNLIPHFLYTELCECLDAGVAVEPGDGIVDALRSVKSEDEVACIRKASRITSLVMDYLLFHIKPGETTEEEIRGMAISKMVELGAEGEAFPMWMLSGEGSNQPISRPRKRVIPKDDMVHIQIGAKYEGYSSALGRPVFTGKPETRFADAIKAGFEGYDALIAQMRDGSHTKEVMRAYHHAIDARGYQDWFLYGPCHSIGLMECEFPWIEDAADFQLKSNMTFCIDLFMTQGKYGFRLEDTTCVKHGEAENLTNYRKDILVI